jgi:hypothetical protein
MTDISGGFMTNRGRRNGSIWGHADGRRITRSEIDASTVISSDDVAESLWVRGDPVITHLSVDQSHSSNQLFAEQQSVAAFLASAAADNDYKESEVSSIPE